MPAPTRTDEIIATVSEIDSLYRRLQTAFDNDAAKALQERARRLREIFRAIEENAPRLVKPNERGDALNRINEQLVVGEAIGLRQFFEQVSTALVDAQSALNRRSLEYVRQLSRLELPIPPAYFAIPSVKAEMKVGFTQISERGVNLLLFTKEEQKKNYGESTVTFELVAAPPPPGQANFGEFVVPIPRVVVLGEEKTAALGALYELAASTLKTQDGKKNKLYENTEQLALVLSHELSQADKPRYLVLWPAMTSPPPKRDSWRELAVFDVVTDGQGKLQLGTGIFEDDATPPNNLLRITSRADLETMQHKELASLALNLGDSAMYVILLMQDWLEAVKVRPPSPPNQ